MKHERPAGFEAETHRTRIDDIDVLRAVAILFVLIQHLEILHPLPVIRQILSVVTFWGGVDIFFAVSGFVIARDLLPKLEAGSKRDQWIEAIAFWIRRGYRILPSAWLWMAIGLVYVLVKRDTSSAIYSITNNINDAIAIIFQFFNYRIYSCLSSGVADGGGCGFNAIYWSLSTEEQFYLLLPILAIFARRRIPVIIAVVLVAQLLWARANWSVGWFFRTDAILFGVLLAIWSRSEIYRLFEPTFLRRRSARWLVILVLLVGVTMIPDDPHGKAALIPIHLAAVALFSAVLVFIASFDKDYVMQPGRLKSAMMWIGYRSYSLYLIHITAFLVCKDIWASVYAAPQSALAIAGLFLTALVTLFTLADANYRRLERPFRNTGRRFASDFIASAETLAKPISAPSAT